MNAGFSNLDFLKKQLLGDGTLKTDTRFDSVIQTIGQGVAAQFQKFCGDREFQRTIGDQEVFPADRAEFILMRYPIEMVTLAEFKATEAAGWIAQWPVPAPVPGQVTANGDPFIRIIDNANGIIDCGTEDAGEPWQQVRFTFNGGFWWPTLEPDDPAYPEQLPAGAYCLPADLLNIWVLQCRHIWANQDKLGTEVLTSGKVTSLRFPEDYAPTVKDSLIKYVRYQLT